MASGYDIGMGSIYGPPTSVGEAKTGHRWLADIYFGPPLREAPWWSGSALVGLSVQFFLQESVATSCGKPYTVYWNSEYTKEGARMLLPSYNHEFRR